MLREQLQRDSAAACGLERLVNIHLAPAVIFVMPGVAEIDGIGGHELHDLFVIQIRIKRADKPGKRRDMRTRHGGSG
ncbi:hypothetical protein D3C73_962250 [compost metagenome]